MEQNKNINNSRIQSIISKKQEELHKLKDSLASSQKVASSLGVPCNCEETIKNINLLTTQIAALEAKLA